MTVSLCVSRCPVGWRGYRCNVAAAPRDSPSSSGSMSNSSGNPVFFLNLVLWSYSLSLLAPLQALPQSSSRCCFCFYWPFWSSVPSCGTRGECVGEFWFQPVSTNVFIRSSLSKISLLFISHLLIIIYFLFPRSLWTKSRSQCSR